MSTDNNFFLGFWFAVIARILGMPSATESSVAETGIPAK
jgi:hypothetical protein